MNPSYYGLADTSAEALNNHLAALIENCLIDLEGAGCVGKQRRLGEAVARPMRPLSMVRSGSPRGIQTKCPELQEAFTVAATTLGRIAAHYYLSHKTVGQFHRALTGPLAKTATLQQLLTLLCDAHEYAELPVRHNEELINAELMRSAPWPVRPPHTSRSCATQRA